MFQSATIKLTLWYAGIIVVISLLFSIIIYSAASSEVGTRIGYLQKNTRPLYIINQPGFNDLRDAQVHEAEANLIISLTITNLCIWITGSIGSYYLAKRTLRPIQEAHEAQSRFTSDASHELKTPLASMKIEIEVALRDRALKTDEMRELLESNLEEVNKLTKLSHTLLQLSRMDHDKIVYEKVSLAVVAKSVIERFDKAGGRIRLHGDRSLIAFANESSVEELFTILVDNAIKYSPDDSVIDITLLQQKNMSGFEIVNAGKGISSDVLPHIFDRFYRADTSRTGGSKKGYGLGLSLAKKIVELHKGELTVSSAPEHNTTFRVLLSSFSPNQAKNQ